MEGMTTKIRISHKFCNSTCWQHAGNGCFQSTHFMHIMDDCVVNQMFRLDLPFLPHLSNPFQIPETGICCCLIILKI